MFSLGRTRGETVGAVGALSAVGFAFVLAVTIGAGAGYLIDTWLGTSPWFFLLFFFFGVAAGILNVFRMSARYLRRENPGTGSDAPSDRA